MRTRINWIDKIQSQTEQCIFDLCYNPSGSQLIVACGQHVLVYESNDGALIELLKGHKEVVYCVCYARDGKKFASGSADKTVIIWTSKLEGLLKYSHNEAVQSMEFNPVSHQLLSCAFSEIALWSTEQKAVEKLKPGGKVNCCAWTKDGQYMVLGLATGYVSIRNKIGEERFRIDRSGDSSIWSLACSPEQVNASDVICIGEWSGILSFYTINGKLLGKEKTLTFIPLKITYFPKGEYIIICGSNKQCHLLSREGIELVQIGNTFSSWAWSCAIHPESSHVTIGCQDGTITNIELKWNIVHDLYEDMYAYRENMTDILIQDLTTNQKMRIKCKHTQEPFTALMPEDLFNISKFVLTKIQPRELKDVSKLAVIYVLVKQAYSLGANKLAIQLFDHLRRMKISKKFINHIETSMIAMKTYPYSDPEELLPLCNKCSTYNQLLSINNMSTNNCTQCGLKFQYSFIMFEILPLVEFELDSDISDDEAQKLIQDPIKLKSYVINTNDDKFTVLTGHTDLFIAQLLQYQEKYQTETVKVNRKILNYMEPSTVLILKWPRPFSVQYYRNLMPDLQVWCCKCCSKFYHADEYELALLSNKYCPFCRASS